MLAKPARQWSRAILLLLLVTGAMDLAGCPDRFNAGLARKTVQSFYDRRLERASLEDLLAPGLRRRERDFLGPSNPRPIAYRLIQLDRRGSRYRAGLVLAENGQAGSWHETEETTVGRRGHRYEIVKVKRAARVGLIPNGRDLMLNAGDKTKARLNLAMLPAQFIPLGGEAPFGVGREGFGPSAFNPANPREAAISGRGLHALLATAVFPLAGGGKPAVRPVDLFFEGQVTGVLWLPAGNLLAAQVLTPAGVEAVYLYEITDRHKPTRQRTPWEKRWSPPASVRLRFFAGEPRALVLSVMEAGGGSEDWAWHVETNRLKPWQGR